MTGPPCPVSRDDLDERLRAVERAMTDGDAAVSDLADAAAVHDRLDGLEAELADLRERLDALDATVQSLHGYVGDLEAVNERVERRADAAREAVERLEDERRRSPQSTTDAERTGGAEPLESGTLDAHRDRPPADRAPADRERTDEDADGSLLDRVRESL